MGACCVPEFGACFENVSEAECEGYGGLWTAGVRCSEQGLGCPDETGACCALDGRCFEPLYAFDCEQVNGVWTGGTFCMNLPQPCDAARCLL